MPKKILIILAAVVLIIFLLFLIGWFMKIRNIDNYLTRKYNEKFEFSYSFCEFLENFRSQYLQIHWGDNGWSYDITVTPADHPEIKFTCYLGIDTIYDNYTYKCLGAELKPHVVNSLSRDSCDFLLDIHLDHCNFVEMYDTKPTFMELKESYALDSTFSFPPVAISIVFPINRQHNIENLLDKCISLIQDTTFGPSVTLGCLFVPGDKYEEIKNKHEQSPEFFHNYFWPPYRIEKFPAFIINSQQSEDALLKRRQKTLQTYQEFVTPTDNS